MKITLFILFLSLILTCCTDISRKEIKVLLYERTTLDTGVESLQPFHHSVPSYLDLPELSDKEIYFADIRQSIFGKRISYLVVKKLNHDLLFIDLNGDSILTNDGGSKVFPYDQDAYTFTIYNSIDSLKYIDLVFQRKPTGNELDSIPPPIVKMYQKKFRDFSGKKGTYFYLNAKMLKRGIVNINNNIYYIGLLDITGNGLFNDQLGGGPFNGDLLLIDLNQDKKLSYEYEGETFNLDEIFRIDNKNYKLKNIDKYGKYLTMIETDEAVSKKFLQQIKQATGRNNRESIFKINPEFWNEEFKTIKDSTINMKSFKSKYILLNFWGEWCAPCVKELPELEYIAREYKSKYLRVISFLKSNNIEKAQKILNDNNIDWPQILFSEQYQKYFNISGYPTNILIMPNGEAIKIKYIINRMFIEKYIK